jgi:hypothetical protein
MSATYPRRKADSLGGEPHDDLIAAVERGPRRQVSDDDRIGAFVATCAADDYSCHQVLL